MPLDKYLLFGCAQTKHVSSFSKCYSWYVNQWILCGVHHIQIGFILSPPWSVYPRSLPRTITQPLQLFRWFFSPLQFQQSERCSVLTLIGELPVDKLCFQPNREIKWVSGERLTSLDHPNIICLSPSTLAFLFLTWQTQEHPLLFQWPWQWRRRRWLWHASPHPFPTLAFAHLFIEKNSPTLPKNNWPPSPALLALSPKSQ